MCEEARLDVKPDGSLRLRLTDFSGDITLTKLSGAALTQSMAVGDSVAAHEAWRRKQRAPRPILLIPVSLRPHAIDAVCVASPRAARPPATGDARGALEPPAVAAAVDLHPGTRARAAVARRGPAQLAVDLERVAAAVVRARAPRRRPSRTPERRFRPGHGRRPGAGRRLAQGAHVQQQPPDDGAPADGAAEDVDLPLPPGWERRFDPRKQRTYFIDHNTRTTRDAARRPSRVLASPSLINGSVTQGRHRDGVALETHPAPPISPLPREATEYYCPCSSEGRKLRRSTGASRPCP